MKLNEIITKSFEGFEEKFPNFSEFNDTEEIKSHIHHLLLSIAKGEVARLEGMKISTRRASSFFGVTAYDGVKRELANLAEENNVSYDVFWDIHNSAISHSLEHWEEIISYLEKK